MPSVIVHVISFQVFNCFIFASWLWWEASCNINPLQFSLQSIRWCLFKLLLKTYLNRTKELNRRTYVFQKCHLWVLWPVWYPWSSQRGSSCVVYTVGPDRLPPSTLPQLRCESPPWRLYRSPELYSRSPCTASQTATTSLCDHWRTQMELEVSWKSKSGQKRLGF